MKPPLSRPRKNPRLDPWVLASKTAQTLAPESSQIHGAIRARDLKKVAGFGQFPDHALLDPDALELIRERQIASLFKKNSGFADEVRCSEAARESFLLAEDICRQTNIRLEEDYINGTTPVEFSGFIRKMQVDLERLLGDTPDVAALCRYIEITNGATEDRSRKRALPFLKITGKIRCPSKAVPLLAGILTDYGVSQPEYFPVESNRVVFVPKNWKTHRTIAAEPTHSLPLQLAVGTVITRALRRWKVDLRDQQKNQDLARRGSVDGSYATIDLSMASDTLALNAVHLLLPIRWAELLVSLRSSFGRLPWGGSLRYEKFSSMGNGYTFPLESAIFAAAVRSIGVKDYAVYGDDIIVPTDSAETLIGLLQYLGFTVNIEKSYISRDSRFRESCGGDFYRGRLITPFYLRELPKWDEHAAMSHIVNGLVAVTHPGPLWTWFCDHIKRYKIRVVPYNGDSRSGVFITPHHAYATRRIRTETAGDMAWKPYFDGYGTEVRERDARGWRSYLLWFLQQSGRARRSKNESRASARDSLLRIGFSITEVPVGVRYRRKRCAYCPPHTEMPSSLYLWDGILEAAKVATSAPVHKTVR